MPFILLVAGPPLKMKMDTNRGGEGGGGGNWTSSTGAGAGAGAGGGGLGGLKEPVELRCANTDTKWSTHLPLAPPFFHPTAAPLSGGGVKPPLCSEQLRNKQANFSCCRNAFFIG